MLPKHTAKCISCFQRSSLQCVTHAAIWFHPSEHHWSSDGGTAMVESGGWWWEKPLGVWVQKGSQYCGCVNVSGRERMTQKCMAFCTVVQIAFAFVKWKYDQNYISILLKAPWMFNIYLGSLNNNHTSLPTHMPHRLGHLCLQLPCLFQD